VIGPRLREKAMADYYAVLWIPYLLLLFYLYRKRSPYAANVLIVVGMLQYKLPIFFVGGIEPNMFLIGAIFCIFISLIETALTKNPKYILAAGYDTLIQKALLVYVIMISVSVFTISPYSLFQKISYGIDYALVAFIVMQCVKNHKDVISVITGMVASVLLMATVGLVGYYLEDPFWGHTISKDQQGAICAKASPNLTYQGRLKQQAFIDKGRQFLPDSAVRPRFTSTSPNEMGLTMLLSIPLVVFLYFQPKAARPMMKLFLVASSAVLLICMLLSGSRTVIISCCLFLPLLFFMLLRIKRIGKIRFICSILILSVFGIPAVFSSSVGDLSKTRFETIQTTGDLIDANGRLVRWALHVRNLTPSIVAFGNGQHGSTGGFSSLTHSNYLLAIYRGGGFAFLAFLVCIYRSGKRFLRNGNRLFRYCLFVTLSIYVFAGITLDLNISVGPPFIFWSLVGLSALRG